MLQVAALWQWSLQWIDFCSAPWSLKSYSYRVITLQLLILVLKAQMKILLVIASCGVAAVILYWLWKDFSAVASCLPQLRSMDRYTYRTDQKSSVSPLSLVWFSVLDWWPKFRSGSLYIMEAVDHIIEAATLVEQKWSKASLVIACSKY